MLRPNFSAPLCRHSTCPLTRPTATHMYRMATISWLPIFSGLFWLINLPSMYRIPRLPLLWHICPPPSHTNVIYGAATIRGIPMLLGLFWKHNPNLVGHLCKRDLINKKTYKNTCKRLYIWLLIRLCVWTFVRMYVHTHKRISNHTYKRTCKHTYLRHTYLRICTYKRTYVHTYKAPIGVCVR